MEAAELELTIERIQEANGTIMVQVLDREPVEGQKSHAVGRVIVPAAAGSVKIVLPLPSAKYVVRVVHDLNGNRKLDTNLLGMPNEPWGVSNNAQGNFGPPVWADMQFELGKDGTKQRIVLNQ